MVKIRVMIVRDMIGNRRSVILRVITMSRRMEMTLIGMKISGCTVCRGNGGCAILNKCLKIVVLSVKHRFASFKGLGLRAKGIPATMPRAATP